MPGAQRPTPPRASRWGSYLVGAALLFALTAVSCQRPSDEEVGDSATDFNHETKEQLYALGYADAVPVGDSESVGVTVHEQEASAGWNYFLTGNRQPIVLMDNDGNELQSWHFDSIEEQRVILARPIRDGHLVLSPEALYRLTWGGDLVWRTPLRGHHDLFLSTNEIFVLTKGFELLELPGGPVPTLANFITTLSLDGATLRTLHLGRTYRNEISSEALAELASKTTGLLRQHELAEIPTTKAELPRDLALLASAGQPGDLLHANSVFVMPRDVAGMCGRGSLLVSVRNLDRLSCLDPLTGEELWFWGPGEIERQHQATLTSDDRVLLFDNGYRRGSSRVLLVDPTAGAVNWTYETEGFFSKIQGGVTELPNGNLLVVESIDGRVVELTPDQRTVWEFFGPIVDGSRQSIYRFTRYPERMFPSPASFDSRESPPGQESPE